MDNIYPKAFYEGNWYKVSKIDFQYQLVYLLTMEGTSKIHMCYIDKIEDIVLNVKD